MQSAGRSHLAATLDRTLPILAAALTAFYALLVAYWVAAIRPAFPGLLVAWLAAAAASGAVTLAARRDPRRPYLWPILAVTVATASGNLVLATGNPALSVAAFIAILGLSLILVSRATLAAAAAIAGAFEVAAALRSPDPLWSAYVIAFAACAVLAFVTQWMRLGLYRRIEAAHAQRLEADRLAQTETRLRHEAEAASRFLALSAHEIGTPLTSITLQVRRLVHLVQGQSEAGKAAAVLDRNVNRLNRIVANVMLLAKAQNGQLRLQRAPTDVDAWLKAAIDAAAAASDRKDVALKAHGGSIALGPGATGGTSVVLRLPLDAASPAA